MHNELLTIGPVTIYGYGLMIAIGIICAYFMAEYRAKKLGLKQDMVFSLVLCCVIFGFLGSKILYFLTQLHNIIEDPSLLTELADGGVVYGGIIGGIFGAWVCCKFHHVYLLDYLDLAGPACALAQGFGRIGCFLAGCCYGRETDSFFAITFHHSAYAPNDVPLLPTQLISSSLDFANCLLLLWVAGKSKKRGLVTGLFLTLYSIGRFILEFFRGDLVRGKVGLLSTSQFIGLFTCGAGLIILLYSLKKGKVRGEEV